MASTTPRQPTRLSSEYADDPDMNEIVRAFAADMPAKVADLIAAWERRDLDRLMRLAHLLKASSGGYGFPSLSEAAGRLEESLSAVVGRGEPAPLARIQSEYSGLITLCRSVHGGA